MGCTIPRASLLDERLLHSKGRGWEVVDCFWKPGGRQISGGHKDDKFPSVHAGRQERRAGASLVPVWGRCSEAKNLAVDTAGLRSTVVSHVAYDDGSKVHSQRGSATAPVRHLGPTCTSSLLTTQ